MKTNLLYRNIFLIAIASSVGLSGCNSGNKATQNGPTNEYVQNQQEKLHFVGNKKSSGASSKSSDDLDGVVFGFDNIQIGTGINPITNEVFNSSKPEKEDTFYYYNGDDLDNKSNYIRPLSVCSAFSLVSSAQENGKVKSTSSAQIFSGEAGVGLNLGLAKLKAAASYSNEKIDENGNLSIRKDIGAKLNCKVYSYADPKYDAKDIGPKIFGSALIKSNQSVANAIKAIRSATTVALKQQKIQEFYANFGTHMVSSVDVSQVASSSSIMKQNTSTSSTTQKAAVSAEFSFGSLANATTEFSMAKVDKFESKSWDYKINEKYFPSDTKLIGVITSLKGDLEKMRQQGIIDFNQLKPEAIEVTLPKAPDLTKLTVNTASFKNDSEAALAYKALEADVPTFNENLEITKEIQSEDIIDLLNEELSSILSNVDTLNKIGSSSLTYGQYNTFLSIYSPISKAVAASKLSDAFKSGDYNKIISAISKYDTYYNAYSSNPQKTQNDMKTFVDKVKAFKTQYQTLKIYFEKYAYAQEKIKGLAPKDWTTKIMTQGDEDSKAIYAKYKASYESQAGSSSTATKLAVNSAKSSTKSIALKEVSGNPFGAIYDNNIVTNFNVVPWSRVFPELAQTFTLDDTSEVVLEGIDKTIDDFERQYKYLLFSMKLDNTNNSVSNWFSKERNMFKVINALKSSIAEIRASLDSSVQSVSFNGSNYNIATIDGLSSLNNAVTNYIDNSDLHTNSEFKNWINALNVLKQYSLIGNFGAVPAYSVHGGYNNSDKDDTTIIPMAQNVDSINYSNDNQKNNPIRTILQLISMNLFDNKPVVAQSYNPGNIERKTYENEPYNDDFNGKFNAKYNPDNAISNMIPNDGKSYPILGVLPVITSNTKVTDSGDFINISNVALVDSSGNIWNQNASKTNALDQFVSNTNLFTLKINKSNGITTIVEAKFYEYHWKFGNDNNKSYNNMIMLSHTKSNDNCWGKGNGHYTPTCVQTDRRDSNDQAALQIYPINNQEATRLGSGWLYEGLVKADEYCRIVNPKGSTSVSLNNGIFFSDTYYNANNWFCMEQFTYERSLTGSGKVARDGIWLTNGNGYIKSTYEWNRGFKVDNLNRYTDLFNKYRDSSEHIPHGLRLIPMSPELISKVAGKIDGNKQKLPLLPGYYF